jgi:hypothetical protein
MTARLIGTAALLLAATAGVAQPPADGPARPTPAADPPSFDGRPLPALPPTPVVQIVVLVPQDAAPGQAVPYQIKVANTSAARAHRVRVRMPWPAAAASAERVEPPAKDGTVPGKELAWEFNTLEANESRTIALAFRPAANQGELEARAYVSFEHGQRVVTRLSAPKLKVRAEAPRQAASDDVIPVRMTLTNTGRVPAEGVRLTVNVSDGFEFGKDDGGEPTRENPLQRVWEVGTVPVGGSRSVAVRLRARQGRKLLVTANVNSKNAAADKDEAAVEVLDAKVKVVLRTEDTKVTGDAAARYEAEVRNDGTLPLTNVRVTGGIPEDCKATKATNGAKVLPDRVEWVLPKLAPGEARTVRWQLRCEASGRRRVQAAVVAGRGLEEVSAVETYFQGAASLNWATAIDTAALPVDRNAVLTVKVTNGGSEPAGNVRLGIDVPKEVSVVQATPAFKRVGERLEFDPMTVAAGRTEAFTVTFKGEAAGKAYFDLKLSADALNGTPLSATKYVDVTPRR